MICQQCGSILGASDIFCQNCGARNPNSNVAFSGPGSSNDTTGNPQVEKVTGFFKNTFFGIVKSILTRPIQGTFEVFSKTNNDSYSHAIILIGTTGITFFILPLIFFNKYLGNQGAGMFFRLGIIISLILIIISGLTYIVKALSGQPDFRKELLTGGICGIPLIIWAIYSCFFGSSVLAGFNIFSNLSGIGFGAGILAMFLILFLFNIVQQSLKSSNTNDAISWYISPIIIILSFYLGLKIGASFIGSLY